jgi:hypothetical protein
MTGNNTAPDSAVPIRRQAVVFRGKSFLLQSRRFVVDLQNGKSKKFPRGNVPIGSTLIASSISNLWTESNEAEKALVAGKIQNLRVAVRNIDGITVPAGQLFSFWKQVGRTSRFRGYVEGRELREGCLIANVGGGLCQLSNALYDAALNANFEIVERHPHSKVVEGSLAEVGRDATVFWNYIDLRFSSSFAFHIKAKLTSNKLRIEIYADRKSDKRFIDIARQTKSADFLNSCASCGADECHRVVRNSGNERFGRTAFLVDDMWPEFDEYIAGKRTSADTLMIPIDGDRFRRANYAWATDGFGTVYQSLFTTAVRSYTSRKLAAQGAGRQKNLLRSYQKLADSYARRLTREHLHVVVQQNLLPFLWRAGHLGGRTFDVLMTAMPMREIQRRLDFAYSLHPESKTLADFRADEELLDAEAEALLNTRKIITSHTEIAELFPGRSELIDWQMPFVDRTTTSNKKPVVVFPATTVGRKGCYEMREAIRGFDVKLQIMGPLIESSDFWDGFDVVTANQDWLSITDLVVLPAFVEHKPRRLLRAAAAGIPVIASTACGISNVTGIKQVYAGDAVTLRDAIKECLDKNFHSSKQLIPKLVSQSIGSEVNR